MNTPSVDFPIPSRRRSSRGPWLLALCCLAGGACEGPPRDAPRPSGAPSHPEAAAPAAAGPATRDTPPSGGRKTLEQVQMEIQPKGLSQPGPAPMQEPAAKPAPEPTTVPLDPALAKEVEELARRLVDALRRKDSKAAGALLVSAEEMGAILQPGVRDILAGTQAGMNQRTLERLEAAIDGRQVEVAVAPGTYAVASKSTYQAETPIVSGTKLNLRIEGIAIPVVLEQVVRLDDRWAIFRLSTP